MLNLRLAEPIGLAAPKKTIYLQKLKYFFLKT